MILLLLASLMAFILKKVKDMETFISISRNPCLFVVKQIFWKKVCVKQANRAA